MLYSKYLAVTLVCAVAVVEIINAAPIFGALIGVARAGRAAQKGATAPVKAPPTKAPPAKAPPATKSGKLSSGLSSEKADEPKNRAKGYKEPKNSMMITRGG